MARIEDIATEFSSGEIKIELEHKVKKGEKIEWVLKPLVKHKTKLMFVNRKLEKDDIEERTLDDQYNILKDVIKTSYPQFTTEQIDNIIIKYGDELLLELYFAWNWKSREAFDAIKKKQQMLIEEMESPKV